MWSVARGGCYFSTKPTEPTIVSDGYVARCKLNEYSYVRLSLTLELDSGSPKRAMFRYVLDIIWVRYIPP